VRLLIVMHLEESGFRVTDAASAEQAITRPTEDDTVVLVFNDIQMPGTMDGVDLARGWRGSGHG
jgi:two-component system, response regulator PdtaR